MRGTTLDERTFDVAVGPGILLGVLPLHRGHHPIWASGRFQVDLCNMVDDVVVRVCGGPLYRFPITQELMPWLTELIGMMDEFDEVTDSPWCEANIIVRSNLLYAAQRRLEGRPPRRNTFEPGLVGPAATSFGVITAPDLMVKTLIADRPGCLVDETNA